MSKRGSVSVDSPRREEATRWESLDEAANFAAKETNEGPRRSKHIQPHPAKGDRQPRCEGSVGSPEAVWWSSNHSCNRSEVCEEAIDPLAGRRRADWDLHIESNWIPTEGRGIRLAIVGQ